MTPEQTELLQKLEAFAFDAPGAQFTFAQRLMRENGWTAEVTRRALREYRRFLFLSVCAGHPVCPSEAVDQVWHLHLVYTRSYWDELCGRILGTPLHHGPTRGGQEEGAKHHDMYMQTLDSYRRIFGEEPPREIWPPVDERFRDGANFTRISRREYWMLRKPGWLRAAAILAPVLLGGCEGTGSGPLDYRGPDFLLIFLFFCIGVCAVIAGLKSLARRGVSRRADDAILGDPYLATMLAGGDSLVITAAISELSRRGVLSIAGWNAVSRVPGASPVGALHPFEAAILERMPEAVASPREIACSVAPELRALRERLELAGMVVTSATQTRLRRGIGLLAALIAIVGLVKIGVGLDRGKPVAFLVVLTVLGTGVAWAMRRPPFRTHTGDGAIRDLRANYNESRVPLDGLHRPDLATGMLPLALAVYGSSVLMGTPYQAFAKQPPVGASNSGSGCSAGCGSGGGSDGGGSSGCSSGCGGCGGGGGD